MERKEYKIGQIIRYKSQWGSGPTALMKITNISKNHGLYDRYYGEQLYGSSMGVYITDIIGLASKNDKNKWVVERTKYHLTTL